MSRKLGTDKPTTVTRVNLLLDSSGSMESRKDTTKEALKEFISGLKKEELDKKITILLTIKTFESGMLNELVMNDIINNTPVGVINDNIVDKYSPNGGTPLYDALGAYIIGIESKQDVIDIFVIQTDGEENASKKYTKSTIKKLIDDKQNNDRWQFVFLGCAFDAMGESAAVGVSRGNTFNFVGGQSVPVYSAMASAVGDYSKFRSLSKTSVNTSDFAATYIQPNLTKDNTNTSDITAAKKQYINKKGNK